MGGVWHNISKVILLNKLWRDSIAPLDAPRQSADYAGENPGPAVRAIPADSDRQYQCEDKEQLSEARLN